MFYVIFAIDLLQLQVFKLFLSVITKNLEAIVGFDKNSFSSVANKQR